MEYTILILPSFLCSRSLCFRNSGANGCRTALPDSSARLCWVQWRYSPTSPQYTIWPTSGWQTAHLLTLMPYNCTWLPFTPTLSIGSWASCWTPYGDDADCHKYRIVHGWPTTLTSYMKGERGFQRYSTLLRCCRCLSILGLVVGQPISSRCTCSGSWWCVFLPVG